MKYTLRAISEWRWIFSRFVSILLKLKVIDVVVKIVKVCLSPMKRVTLLLRKMLSSRMLTIWDELAFINLSVICFSTLTLHSFVMIVSLLTDNLFIFLFIVSQPMP